MADTARDSLPFLCLHERILLGLGMGTCVGLGTIVGFGDLLTWEAIAATAVFFGGIRILNDATPTRIKARLVAAFLFAGWFYLAVGRLTPALGFPLRDGALLAADRRLFGETPAIAWQSFVHPSMTDLMSACYLSYHVYIAALLIYALGKPVAFALRSFEYFCTALGIGMVGYLVLPAVGPYLAFPDAFSAPLTGGWPSRLNRFVVESGSNRFDAFPSLHVSVTLAMLHHDWFFVRWRFWVMLGPALGLAVSTMYLRYHYVSDLLSGVLLFGVLATWFQVRWRTWGELPSLP